MLRFVHLCKCTKTEADDKAQISSNDRRSEIVQVQARLFIETAAGLAGEALHHKLAGAVHAGGQEMAADAGVIPPAGRNMQVQIHFPALAGNIAGEVRNLHLFGEGLVHVFLRGGVQEAESRFGNGAEPIDGSAADIQLSAEGGKGLGNLHMVVEAQDILVPGSTVCVHGRFLFQCR